MSEPVKIAVILEGGLVQAVLTAGVPVECVVIDHDTEGAALADPNLMDVPQGPGLTAPGYVFAVSADDAPADREKVMWAHDAVHGREAKQ